jgi:hypothetical protein
MTLAEIGWVVVGTITVAVMIGGAILATIVLSDPNGYQDHYRPVAPPQKP